MQAATAPIRQIQAPQRVMIGWASEACPEVSAVLVPVNAPLPKLAFLGYLQDRVEAMLAREVEPVWGLLHLTDRLQDAGLLSHRPNLRNPDEALSKLIFRNQNLHLHLDSLGALPGNGLVSRDNPEARSLVQRVSLEQWLNALTGDRAPKN